MRAYQLSVLVPPHYRNAHPQLTESRPAISKFPRRLPCGLLVADGLKLTFRRHSCTLSKDKYKVTNNLRGLKIPLL